MTRRNPQALIKVLPTEVRPDWMAAAACKRPGVDRDAFFPDHGDDVHAQARAAKAVCATCPVDHAVCAEFGDLVSKDFGTFGGRTASERKARRSLGRAA